MHDMYKVSLLGAYLLGVSLGTQAQKQASVIHFADATSVR
jgi:hypothetical protein